MLRSCVVVGHERLLWNWSYLEPARKWGWIALPACSLVFLGLAIWKGQTTRQTPLLAVQIQPSHSLYGVTSPFAQNCTLREPVISYANTGHSANALRDERSR